MPSEEVDPSRMDAGEDLGEAQVNVRVLFCGLDRLVQQAHPLVSFARLAQQEAEQSQGLAMARVLAQGAAVFLFGLAQPTRLMEAYGSGKRLIENGVLHSIFSGTVPCPIMGMPGRRRKGAQRTFP